VQAATDAYQAGKLPDAIAAAKGGDSPAAKDLARDLAEFQKSYKKGMDADGPSATKPLETAKRLDEKFGGNAKFAKQIREKLVKIYYAAGLEAKAADNLERAYTNFEKALQHLREAVKLNNDLWRAHYFIGRIYRDTGKSKEAAEELTKALQSGPTEIGPWVALAELYHQWDYTDQAIQVAEAGTLAVPGANEKSDVWYEVGRGYDDKRLDDRAIDAYSKALESRRDNHKARFQRGQAYFRKGDYTNAKRDLEEFAKAGGSSVEFPKQQASKMLIDIAAKSAAPGTTPVEKASPEDMVKRGR
jgi:tetratricopeptide (TPR) repeat protein